MNNMPHPKKPIPGEEEHASFILNKLEELYLDEDSPSKDVTLLVEGRKFKAHKWILSMQNFGIFCHFSGDVEFVVKGISSDGFEQVLRYLYTGRISLSVLTDKVLFDILRFASQELKNCFELCDSICKHIKSAINSKKVMNVFTILANARSFSSPYTDELIEECYTIFDKKAAKILKHGNFTKLKESEAMDIVSRPSLLVSEIDKFHAIQRYLTANPSVNAANFLRHVNLHLMSPQELLKIVRPTKRFDAEILLNAVAAAQEEGEKTSGHLLAENNSFVCVGCNSSVCKESDIFPMFKEGQQSDYRNAIGTTFDLVTVVTVQGLRLADESLDEYLSWYPGYAWAIANCGRCLRHIGWKFTALGENLIPQAFWGLSRKSLKYVKSL